MARLVEDICFPISGIRVSGSCFILLCAPHLAAWKRGAAQSFRTPIIVWICYLLLCFIGSWHISERREQICASLLCGIGSIGDVFDTRFHSALSQSL